MNQFVPEETQKVKPEKSSSSIFSMTKVFLWLALGLAISGVVALGLPDLMLFIIKNNSWAQYHAELFYKIFVYGSVVLMIPSVIMMNLKAWRPKSVWMVISYIVYTIAMGVLLSSSFVFIAIASEESSISFAATVSIAFFLSALAFIIIGVVAMFTKKNLGILIPYVLCLLFGVGAICLVNFFLGSSYLYWISDSIVFALILIITAIDMNRVKRIAENGGFSSNNNLAIYCAYTLYVDFIDIFLRVLYYVVLSSSKKKK